MIPPTAHFVWYGSKLSYLHALAIRSAATHGGFESVRLHHADPLDEAPYVQALGQLPNFQLVALDDRALCDQVVGPELSDLVTALEAPEARSNVVRAALLYRDGGVYLDMDTLTIRSFDEVRRAAPGFVGQERIVFPGEVVASRNPRVKGKAYLMTTVRDLYRRIPRGYRYFRRIERHYHQEVNNAIFGAVAGHGFWASYLNAMTRVPRRRWNKRYALGTHLLQSVYKTYEGGDLHTFPPAYFYPLPPEISQHWFRFYQDGVDPMEVLDSRTCCIHSSNRSMS